MVPGIPSGLEVLLFVALVVIAGILPLILALAPTGRRTGWLTSRKRRLLVLFGLASCLTAAGLVIVPIGTPMVDRELIESNPEQLPTDGYAGSKSCQACHPQEYDSWRASYHSTMTQVATSESVVAPFDGVRLETRGRAFRLERRDGQFWAYLEESAIPPPPGSRHTIPSGWNRIVMTTGSHHMQVYWIATPDDYYVHFPWEYFIDEQRWIPTADAFLMPDRPETDIGWEGCPACHTTRPQPRKDPDRREKDHRVAELGISCESCHGPAAEHVQVNASPVRRYTFHLDGLPDPTIINPAKQSKRTSVQICGQCHSVFAFKSNERFYQHGRTYQIGDNLGDHLRLMHSSADVGPGLTTPFWSDGTVRVGGREYMGLAKSACFTAGEITCLSCHSMHRSDPDHQLGADMEGNEACLQCHASYSQTLSEHTHHRSDSAGSLCYNCHMPNTSYALLGAIRSHRIENPRVATAPGKVKPNACNLCHLDKPLAWAAERMTAWYAAPVPPLTADERSVAAGVLWGLRGDAAQRAVTAWHMGWNAAHEASGKRWLAPYLATLLTDPYASVRSIAYTSLRKLPGYGDFEYDFIGAGANEEHHRARLRAMDIWRQQPASATDPTGAAVLIDPRKGLQTVRLQRLLSQRDDTPIGIFE